jgi:hypothetical protein
MRLLGCTQKHNERWILMAFIYKTFDNQGGVAGNSEIVAWMTENFPGMFDSYDISNNDLICKIGDATMLRLNNTLASGRFGAGFYSIPDLTSHSFYSNAQTAYSKVVADTEAQVVAFLSGGGGYPIITLCKNEDGDTCGVAFIYPNSDYIFQGEADASTIHEAKAFVYNFTKNTYQPIPCGFGVTAQNAVCGYSLIDAGGKKIQNVWVGGSSSLHGLSNPIEILVDGVLYCSIGFGWLLIK